jgi:acetyl/propionyl-CoA carboxylase alpha subunit
MPFAKLLIANRGEIACRIIRTARAMGVAAVAVHSEIDRDALHVEMADEAIALGGVTPAASYLRIEAVLDAASRTGADAVHPGYGFLSERADFARACEEAGLVFVGPSSEAIAAMGDKLAAKHLMAGAGVPVLTSMTTDDVPTDAYPVLVKAAMGGGGKGMRVVRRPEDLVDAVAAAQRESAGAFGDDTVFIERYLERPRHLEVQILGDHHGTVLHLGERECSLQRRHQKVIEESPSPMVDAELRERLGTAAVTAARAIGYANAGTVEFIATPDGEFSFLEVNTRLQVEHPVTELAWALGDEPLDLVRLQLLVASGAPLEHAQSDLRRIGHAVEARLYAEDPAADFLPAAGRLDVFEPAEGPGVRVDAGVRSGDVVSVHYDPLLAKVIASAPTRAEAVGRLARALETSRVHGVTTNRDLLVASLRHPAFVAGELHTGFLEEHLPLAERTARPDAEAVAVAVIGAVLSGVRSRHRAARVLATLPPTWRNNPQPQEVAFDVGGEEVAVRYHLRRDGRWQLVVADVEHVVGVLTWPDERADGRLVVDVGGRRLAIAATPIGNRWHVDSPLGAMTLAEQPRFPVAGTEDVAGGMVAPMPGTVVEVLVTEGQEVGAGAVLVLIEAMKMEHRITANGKGTVAEIRVSAGQSVEADQVLVVLDEDPPPSD